MIRVALIEEMRVLRDAVASMLDQHPGLVVVGKAGSAAEAIPLAEETSPDVIVMDAALGDRHGVVVADEVRRRWPGTRILLLLAQVKPGVVREALMVGVDGLLPMAVSMREVIAAITEVHEGKRVLDPDMVAAALEIGDNPLSPRERTVLRLIADGDAPGVIGRSLHLAEGTVRNHITRAIGKLAARNVMDAVRIADRMGWLEYESGLLGPEREVA
ncbi:MAG: response regulator transcription factor [Actinomycetota bacterium]|nr:response regulator transcription factor [Actinomycetota bacterium]